MAATAVAIIDSGGANIASLQFALQRLQADSTLTSDPDIIRNASHVILPGVGAAANAMQRLADQQLSDLIPTLTQPVLGICLGMQLLADSSDEQATDCLGIIPGTAEKLPANSQRPVPNMGWCQINTVRNHELLHNIDNGSYFYFLHSYVLPVQDCTLATAAHAQHFTAILAQKNFVATQFHPERSARAGAQLLHNFLEMRA